MFEGIKKKLFTQEFLDQNATPQPPVQEEKTTTVKKATVNPPSTPKVVTVTFDDNETAPEVTTVPASAEANQEMVEKIYALMEKLNKDGIDFFEVWNATEQMDGGITNANVKNAFIALKAASGNKLTKEYVLETAQYYCDKIQEALDTDIKQKKTERNKMIQSQSTEKESLQSTVDNLAQQIETLTKEKEAAEQSLSKIDSKYRPSIQKIEERISSGTAAVQSVRSEIESFVDIFNKVVK